MERLNESGSEKRRDFLKQFTGGMIGLSAVLGLPASSEGATKQSKPARLVIEHIEAFKVVVPRKKIHYIENDPRLLPSFNPHKFILKLYGDNGFVGLGESFRNYSEDALKENIRFLTGKDVLSLDFTHPTLELPQSNNSDAFEMAIFDLIGKTWGVPVYKLLGGKYQDKVAVTYHSIRRTGKDLERSARKAVDMGYKGYKYKQRPQDSMVEQIRTIHKVAPELKIVIDPNNHFKDLEEFLRQAKQLEGYNIQCIESPMPVDINTYVRISEELQKINIPLCIHTSNLRIITEAIKAGACQIFNLGGDMRAFVRLCHIIDAFGFTCWHGSGNEIGVKDASFVQAIAATPNCIIPSDVLGYLIRIDDLLVKSFTVKDGYATVPDDPGLGVELDEDAVKKYSV